MSGKGDNSTPETDTYESANMCLELALEGERLCKAGDCRAGVAFFQAAIRSGTDDLRTLSAIYSQLGNAYFYLGDYVKAMQFHKHDLTLARTMGDKLGEAKSSGNLGNTLKVMGKFDEAVICCKRHLEISRQLNDKSSEGRALYNLGNVYHAKGKHIGRIGQQDPGEFPEDVRHCLDQAVFYYKENLKLMEEVGDSAAQGRACGNLGNTYYLLGDFQEAINYHDKRLRIAREFGDKAAERRAYSNLGNCHIFLGDFQAAAHHYKKTLTLGGELGDKAVEAQACYSLGNTYTLLRQYPTAIDYHERHLEIAQSLGDCVGQARACWSLGNAHSALGQHDKALEYSIKHLQLSKEVGDTLGMATAQMNISDLRKALGINTSGDSLASSCGETNSPVGNVSSDMSPSHHRVRRDSMSRMDIIKLTPDMKGRGPGGSPLALPRTPIHAEQQLEDDDQFFDLLSRFQSERMEDQRCSLSVSEDKENQQNNLINNGEQGQEELLELIVGIQSKRMDEQRVSLPVLPELSSRAATQPHVPALPGLSSRPGSQSHPPDRSIPESNNDELDGCLGPDDAFLEMLMRCQSERLEDQRSELPDNRTVGSRTTVPQSIPGFTVPDEDFFSLIMRLQSGRMEDQRAAVPPSIE